MIAMQGNVAMETVRRFMPTFFQELARDGQIDRAMAAARGAIRETEDWWMPALFMSLKRGQISWYRPGFESEDEQKDFRRWAALVGAITDRACTPILGSGLLEPIVGSFRELARKLADRMDIRSSAPHEKTCRWWPSSSLLIKRKTSRARNSRKLCANEHCNPRAASSPPYKPRRSWN